MADESVATECSPGLSLEIGSAMALGTVILGVVNGASVQGLNAMLARSDLDADDFVCLVMQLRDRLRDVCKMSGVKA